MTQLKALLRLTRILICNSSGKSFEDVNITGNSGKTMAVSENFLSDTPQDKSNNNCRSKKRQSVSSAKSSTSPLNQS